MATNDEKKQFLKKNLSQANEANNANTQKDLRALLLSEGTKGKLYKYRSFKSEYAFPNLLSGTLYCSKASAFNDPFDCRPGIDFKTLYEAIIGSKSALLEPMFNNYLKVKKGLAKSGDFPIGEQDIFAKWDNSQHLSALLDYVSRNQFESEEAQTQYIISHFNAIIELYRPLIECSGFGDSFKDAEIIMLRLSENMTTEELLQLSNNPFNFQEFAKSQGIDVDNDEIANTVALHRILYPNNSEAADKAEKSINDFIQKLSDKLIDTFQIGCLSTDLKNRLMWSHYADNHRGFCIEYDFSEMPDDMLPLPVVYSQERIKFPWGAYFNNDIVALNLSLSMELLTKDEVWEYEKEWRILLPSSSDPNLKIPISCIYLGAKCTELNKAAILQIAEHLHIPVKQMVMDRGEYLLHAQPI